VLKPPTVAPQPKRTTLLQKLVAVEASMYAMTPKCAAHSPSIPSTLVPSFFKTFLVPMNASMSSPTSRAAVAACLKEKNVAQMVVAIVPLFVVQMASSAETAGASFIPARRATAAQTMENFVTKLAWPASVAPPYRLPPSLSLSGLLPSCVPMGTFASLW